ncbi:hypothetical protein ELE36_18790 [Pseudolysobacter antarcticus]|uniref:Uncharacterized protein n=1 Tax=Pseudolysobacter antarcticus TaxID=2511995 RepID=A0A411HPA2_9GAMM|nr:hypothetical protein [Pseudolysobacter antarcticus]QBB72250.1 hypothetical protein ELE36_18790 [Pseudolysobacter antarcticus]
MNRIRRIQSLIILTVILLVGCSPGIPANFDFEKTESEVNHLSSSLFEAMSNGTEATAYETLLDEKAKKNISLEAFVAMSKAIISKLGAFKSLEAGSRSDYDPRDGGLLARVAYVRHFENGNGDITIGALLLKGSWRILSFNVNSPLLSANPSGYRKNVELYVTNSDLVMPGAHIRVMAHDRSDKILVDDAQVLNVRWKVSLTNAQEGFVTVSLSESEAAAIKNAGELSVKSRK